MELEVFAPSIPYLATVLVVGLFLWRVFVRMLAGMEARFNYLDKQVSDQFRQVTDQFKQVDTRFASLESRFDSLDTPNALGHTRRVAQRPSPGHTRAPIAHNAVGDGLVPSRHRTGMPGTGDRAPYGRVRVAPTACHGLRSHARGPGHTRFRSHTMLEISHIRHAVGAPIVGARLVLARAGESAVRYRTRDGRPQGSPPRRRTGAEADNARRGRACPVPLRSPCSGSHADSSQFTPGR